MKRSSFITWDQLKVGALIIIALLITGVAVLKLGQQGNIFAKRYTLISFLGNASGLRVGGGVTVAGQLAGNIKAIEFLPPDTDTARNVRLILEVNQELSAQVRKDSRAKIKTLGLLGDKVFDISPGTPSFRPLREGDTLIIIPSIDYEAVVQQASGAITEVVGLTADIKKMTGAISRGEGTIGQLVTNRQMYDQINNTLAHTSALMTKLENPRGTVGKLLNDPALYNSVNRTLNSVDTLIAQIGSGNGTVGKLLKDDSLYVQLVSIASTTDALVKNLSQGNGTIQKLFTDQQLYDQLVKAVTELNAVLVDVRRDPRRYTKGLIEVF